MKWKLLLSFFIIAQLAFAQESEKINPFQPEIDAFAKADKVMMPDEGRILFVGSSSFNYWKDVNDYFPGKNILNRGFGG